MDNSQNDRIVYFDYLRVAATVAVMMLHISSTKWRVAELTSYEWQVFNIGDSITRWAVPVFVMISGALFLPRTVDMKTIYSKYILRLVTAFLFWSVIYVFFIEGSFFLRVARVVEGHFHMWFIFLIIGLYMCIPFIKPIIENEKRIRYFLVLALVFAFFIPELLYTMSQLLSGKMLEGVDIIGKNVGNMNMQMVSAYVGYFVLGYYLNTKEIEKKHRILIYILGVGAFLATIILAYAMSIHTGSYCTAYYDYYTVNVMLEALAVFTWCKYRKFNNTKINSFIRKLSKYSFGAYLVHALIIEQLEAIFGINTLSFNSGVAVVVITIIVAIVSFAISALLNSIPIIKKYIV